MKLPVVSGNQIIKLLEKEGFIITRQKGFHISLHKRTEGGKIILVVVPKHKEIKKRHAVEHYKAIRHDRDEFIGKLK